MGLDCFGSLGSLLLGAGLGILAVSTLASVIIFGSFYDKLQYPSTYTRYNPTTEMDGIYASALAITILGAIAACAAIAAIALSALMGGNKIVLIIVGGAASVLALGCIISEGIYYGKVRSYSINGQKGNNYVRNSSRAQRYIRNAIEELYTQGYENLKAKYPNQVGEMEDWDTATKKLNEQVTEGNTITVLNYPDFFSTTLPTPGTSKRIYLYSNPANNIIYAYYRTLYIQVASLNFKCENPSSVTHKYYGCWNDTTKLKCKTLDYKENVGEADKYTIFSSRSSPFTIKQTMLYDDNYRTPLQIKDMNKNYQYTKTISGFPVAYRLLTSDDIDAEEKKTVLPYYFEEDTNHFRFSAESYCKAGVKNFEDGKDHADKDGKMTNFLFCFKEPSSSSLEKYIKRETDADCPYRGISRPSLYTATGAPNIPVFAVAYDQIDIGIYPGFHEDYFSYLADNTIYKYNREYTTYAQFAIAQLIIQIVGIVLWGAGKGIGMVFGGSD